ncbi:hypothetical protein ACFC1B_17610 [Streptomyces xiamenensis]|uniref:hypothetical protein n=1 Tax=Streptomyces xiamenensis TaxID=408015 RepID=UPI0035D661DE
MPSGAAAPACRHDRDSPRKATRDTAEPLPTGPCEQWFRRCLSNSGAHCLLRTVPPSLFSTAFLLVDATATDSVRIEANTWIEDRTDISNSILATVIGALADQKNFDTAPTVLSGCAVVGVLTTAVLHYHEGRPQAADPAAAQPTVAAER